MLQYLVFHARFTNVYSWWSPLLRSGDEPTCNELTGCQQVADEPAHDVTDSLGYPLTMSKVTLLIVRDELFRLTGN